MAPTSSTAPKRGISPGWDSHMSVKEPAKKKHRGGKLSKGKIEELVLKKKEFLQYLEEKGDEWGVSSAFLLCSMNLSKSLQTSKTTIAWNKFQHDFAQDCEGDYSAVKASAMFNKLHDEHGGEGSEDWKDHCKKMVAQFNMEKQEAIKDMALVDNNQAVAMKRLEGELRGTIDLA
ncbi:uncharacterized protein EI90DRAFT_3019694 [Cantharellus anzutake]|uniref:uncharacterized protein n=1 Tax=Cantharellus anzutake TaxID=1750568 RepID=UPI001908C140|nr:uncharacterized protein EI90DRAFT_3019694 [Cantharellus anzutake]KAF8324351.1 hypothetical protein EI90DRAFT_3019694 [Cantharellus anzutake]